MATPLRVPKRLAMKGGNMAKAPGVMNGGWWTNVDGMRRVGGPFVFSSS